MAFNELLIEQVKLHPCLFNVNLKEFKNRNIKDNAWNAIGREMQESGDTCSTRWNSLRDRYTREKRKQEKRSGQAASYVSLWEHFDSMAFLKDYVKHRSTISNFHADYPVEMPPMDSCEAFADKRERSNEIEVTEESSCTLESVHAEDENLTSRKKRKSSAENLKESILHTVLQVSKSSEALVEVITKQEPKTINQYQAYGNMVGARLQALDPEKAHQAMLKISGIIFGEF